VSAGRELRWHRPSWHTSSRKRGMMICTMCGTLFARRAGTATDGSPNKVHYNHHPQRSEPTGQASSNKSQIFHASILFLPIHFPPAHRSSRNPALYTLARYSGCSCSVGFVLQFRRGGEGGCPSRSPQQNYKTNPSPQFR